MEQTGSFGRAVNKVLLPWNNNGGGKLAIIEAMLQVRKKLQENLLQKMASEK